MTCEVLRFFTQVHPTLNRSLSLSVHWYGLRSRGASHTVRNRPALLWQLLTRMKQPLIAHVSVFTPMQVHLP